MVKNPHGLNKMAPLVQYRVFVTQVVALLAIVCLAKSRSCQATSVPVEHIEMPTDPRVLPYRCVTTLQLKEPPVVTGTQHFADLDGDGFDEIYYQYSRLIDSSHYSAALVAEPHAPKEGRPVQHNGPLLSCRILSDVAIDLLDSPGEEVILTRQYRDTIFLEIVSFGLSKGILVEDTSIIFPAAIARSFAPREYWHDIHVIPHIATDLNGDGFRDLIYSRSAKPDSAIERAIVAYDLYSEKQLWAYPVPDMVGTSNIRIYVDAKGQPSIVAVISSTANAYTVNGMSSTKAYIIGLNLQGHELWRKTIGGELFYPQLVDINITDYSNPIPAVSCDPVYPIPNDTIVRALDPYSGDVIGSFAIGGHAGEISSFYVYGLWPNLFVCWSDDSSKTVYRLGPDMQPERVWVSTYHDNTALDIRWVLDTLLFAATIDGRQLLLNRDMQPVAMYRDHPSMVEFGHTPYGPQLLSSHSYRAYRLISLEPQSVWVRYYARFQYVLLGLVGLSILVFVWIGIDRIRTWRLAVLGVPTLDSVDALVLLLDRSGRLLFVNKHRLASELIGDWRRKLHIAGTRLAEFPEISEAITRSFDTPMGTFQQRISFKRSPESTDATLEIRISPYVDRHNLYRGKVVLAEELDSETARTWKVVLGESAQNWVHRLKHHFGTIRLIVGNLLSDPVIAERFRKLPELQEQQASFDDEVRAGSEAATKILKYLKNPQPRLIQCDIAALARLVIENRRATLLSNVSVSFLQQCEAPLVLADPDQMREVFDNLLSNAVQAMSRGGNIEVTVCLADQLHTKGAGRCVEIVFEDNGVGIATEDLPHLFEPNFSKTPFGTGIGLAMVREIISNHKGEIAVESKLGEGTRFTIRLLLDGVCE